MAGFRTRIRLGDVLIQKGLITAEQLDRALEEQKKSGGLLGETMVTLGIVSEDALIDTLCEQLGIEYLDLRKVEEIPDDIVSLISEDLIKKYTVMPVRMSDKQANTIVVAMADPMNIVAIDDISIFTGLQIEPVLSTTSQIKAKMDAIFGQQQAQDIAEQYKKEQEAYYDTGKKGDAAEDENRREDVDNSPIVLLVKGVIEQAVRQRASDIHIEAFEHNVRVRYRVDGALREIVQYDKALFSAIIARIKIISGMDISEKRKPQDGRITQIVDRREYDIRVSCLPTVFGEKVVMRIASKEGFKKNKEDLGLRPEDLVLFDNILKNPNGIILVTGPTGSGKSTTLASLINLVNENIPAHVITLEDPIEYLHSHKLSTVNQREIGMDTLSYNNALRAALREDPDVILIGEMRDLETISIAITAAETGHLVFSTLHTIGAAATIDRVIDVFPPHQQQQIRVQLAMVLEAVISQQLMPTADGHGRVAAFEVLHSTPAIKNLIRENKTFQIATTMQTSKKLGMQTMDDSIFYLYAQGIISRDTALNYAQDQQSLEKKLY